MRSQEEEIYISLVVVKRQMKAGQPELDPAVWANAVLESLKTEGGQHQVYTIANVDPLRAAPDRMPPRVKRPFAPLKLASEAKRSGPIGQIPSAVWLVLSIVCMLAAAYLGFLLVRT